MCDITHVFYNGYAVFLVALASCYVFRTLKYITTTELNL